MAEAMFSRVIWVLTRTLKLRRSEEKEPTRKGGVWAAGIYPLEPADPEA
jgi:hypothetical protein